MWHQWDRTSSGRLERSSGIHFYVWSRRRTGFRPPDTGGWRRSDAPCRYGLAFGWTVRPADRSLEISGKTSCDSSRRTPSSLKAGCWSTVLRPGSPVKVSSSRARREQASPPSPGSSNVKEFRSSRTTARPSSARTMVTAWPVCRSVVNVGPEDHRRGRFHSVPSASSRRLMRPRPVLHGNPRPLPASWPRLPSSTVTQPCTRLCSNTPRQSSAP